MSFSIGWNSPGQSWTNGGFTSGGGASGADIAVAAINTAGQTASNILQYRAYKDSLKYGAFPGPIAGAFRDAQSDQYVIASQNPFAGISVGTIVVLVIGLLVLKKLLG